MGAKALAWGNLPWTAIIKSHFVRKVIRPLVLKNQMTDSSRNSAVQIVLHVLNWQIVRSLHTRKHKHMTHNYDGGHFRLITRFFSLFTS